jgi:DNA-binding CsgD family transcriptional regulator
MTQAPFPDRVLERALGDDEPPSTPCTFRDASLLGLVGEELDVSNEEYRGAVDQRRFRVIRRICTPDHATAVVLLEGRQVGTLGSIVPTGRTFSALAHVVVALERGSATSVVVESGLLGHLTSSGVRFVPASRTGVARFSRLAASERPDLLDGDAGATYWAQAWGLPPRLARLAVMLMAGLSPRAIGARARLSLRSVRTYTETLYQRASVHSRGELVLAALRDGRASN